MSDPFSILAGAVGVVGVTLQVASSIISILSDISDASESLCRLLTEIQDLEIVLLSLQHHSGRMKQKEPYREIPKGGKRGDQPNQLAVCIGNCRLELERLRSIVEPFRSRLTDVESGGMSKKLKRGMAGLKKAFKDADIDKAVTSLQSRKLTICLALIGSNMQSKYVDLLLILLST